MPGPEDERAAAQGRGRGELRASNADREQVIDVLKAAFVQGRLAKDEFDLRIGQAFAARTHAELAAVTAGLPAEPTTAKPPAPAQSEPPVVRPGPLIGVATAVCAGVWMFGFLVPWPRNPEGGPPHGVVLLVYSTTLIYLFVLVMTLWLGGAVMVESWLKRRAAPTRPNSTRLRHADDAVTVALNMSNISGVVARVFVDDLDVAIPLYQQLAQTTAVNRFGFRDVQLAQVGPFLRRLLTAATPGAGPAWPPGSAARSG